MTDVPTEECVSTEHLFTTDVFTNRQQMPAGVHQATESWEEVSSPSKEQMQKLITHSRNAQEAGCRQKAQSCIQTALAWTRAQFRNENSAERRRRTTEKVQATQQYKKTWLLAVQRYVRMESHSFPAVHFLPAFFQ